MLNPAYLLAIWANHHAEKKLNLIALPPPTQLNAIDLRTILPQTLPALLPIHYSLPLSLPFLRLVFHAVR